MTDDQIDALSNKLHAIVGPVYWTLETNHPGYFENPPAAAKWLELASKMEDAAKHLRELFPVDGRVTR